MKNKNRAFSLIELSIVILIIGILIAGVTQGSRLIGASKIQVAQTLTQSSPVASINGLVLWLEPTTEKSFDDAQIEDGNTFASNAYWYDINPQAKLGNNFLANTASITYETSGINDLPTVQFAGTDATTPSFAGSLISTPYHSYTIFAVLKSTNLGSANTIFYNGTTGASGFGLTKTTSGFLSVSGGSSGTPFTTRTDTLHASLAGVPEILSLVISPDSVDNGTTYTATTPTIKSYVNGAAAIDSTLDASIVDPTLGMYIGNRASGASASSAFIGQISEIIVFDNALTKADRVSVQKYLSQKYKIDVASDA